MPRRPAGRLRLAVSRTRPPEFVEAVAALLDAELVPMGSAGVKATSVLRGEADAYVHAGGQYEWDIAAPVAVADRGRPAHQPRRRHPAASTTSPTRCLPDLLVCRPSTRPRVLDAVRRRHRRRDTR